MEKGSLYKFQANARQINMIGIHFAAWFQLKGAWSFACSSCDAGNGQGHCPNTLYLRIRRLSAHRKRHFGEQTARQKPPQHRKRFAMQVNRCGHNRVIQFQRGREKPFTVARHVHSQSNHTPRNRSVPYGPSQKRIMSSALRVNFSCENERVAHVGLLGRSNGT